MTRPLSASENTSLALSVRSSEDSQLLKNDAPPLSTPPTAITSIGSAPPTKAKATPPALAWDGPTLYEDEGAQLSERDSIFATHYITSDTTAGTPRLHPTVEGRHDDVLILQHDAATKTESPAPHFSHPPDSAPFFHKTTSSPTISSVSGIEGGLDGRRGRPKCLTSTETESLDFLEYYKTRAGSLDRIGRGERIQVLPPFISPVDTPVDRPSTPRETSARAPMPRDGEHSTVARSRKDERSDRKEPTMSAGNGRSSSRHENGHVDKTIEASLAKAEPAQSARSRKTSHYLGLFKENTPSQEHRRRDDKAKDKTGKEKAIDSDVPGSLGEEIRPTSFPEESYGSTQDHGRRNSDALRGAHPGSTEKQPIPGNRDGIQQEASLFIAAKAAESPCPVEDTNTLLRSNDESVQTEEAENGATASDVTHISTHTLPLRLLEEIRNHHNLTPGGERGTSFSRSIPTVSAEQTKPTSAGIGAHPGSVGDPEVQDGAAADRDSAENEDEDESDKEQISSALYFPHQTPDLETVERVKSSRDTEDEDIYQHSPSLQSEVNVGLERRKTEPKESPSNGVDIDLQSSDKHRYLHGDLQQPLNPLNDAEPQPSNKPSDIGSSSASNSDYESLDETAFSSREDGTNLTDDADTTPTATPVPHTPLTRLKTRSPRQQPAAPLGAVELKPYSHQVGGHTTVFRFSRRAVCKQLSNRENEFYETVERRHPELLRFLPRYVWLFRTFPLRRLRS